MIEGFLHDLQIILLLWCHVTNHRFMMILIYIFIAMFSFFLLSSVLSPSSSSFSDLNLLCPIIWNFTLPHSQSHKLRPKMSRVNLSRPSRSKSPGNRHLRTSKTASCWVTKSITLRLEVGLVPKRPSSLMCLLPKPH